MKENKDEVVGAITHLSRTMKQEQVYIQLLKNVGLPRVVELIVYKMFLYGLTLEVMSTAEKQSYSMLHRYASELAENGFVTFDEVGLPPELREFKVEQELTRRTTNVGWNNFDAYVKNGYLFNPPKYWQGMYYLVYFTSDEQVKRGEPGYSMKSLTYVKESTGKDECFRVVASNDPDLSVQPIPGDFLRFIVRKSGLLERVRVTSGSDGFRVAAYQTWSAGKTSAWKEYKPKAVKLREQKINV